MFGAQRAPNVFVLKGQPQRDHGRQAQLANIRAGKIISDIIRTTLGPRAMLKMILDQMGGITLTADGNAILREIDVTHPAAKSMIDLSRTQDEEVGDGTTSVIVLAGEMLTVAEPFIEKNIHPTRIVKAFFTALDDAIKYIDDELTTRIDIDDLEKVKAVVTSCIGTKFTHRNSDLMCKLAIESVKRVAIKDDDGKVDVDVKRYARIEKIPGGTIEQSQVLDGVCLNKDVTHARMRRRIENPRILLLDCNLEYKKGESQTDVQLENESDYEAILRLEEDWIRKVCGEIIAFKPDLVITEKGVSDLAQHFLMRANISVLRRARKTDNNRIARATGATIVHRTSEIKESDIGTGAGLFEVRLIGDEYFSFIEQCKDPKACTVVLRGPSKDILNEIERNLHDAMGVVRTLYLDNRVVTGGGSVEMAVSRALMEKSKSIKGVEQLPYQAVASALEVIPRTLADNCGAKSTIRLITELRAKHAKGDNKTWGVDGIKGVLVDMTTIPVWEPYQVKVQTIKTAIESSCMLLRIDDVVSSIPSANQPGGAPAGGPGGEEM